MNNYEYAITMRDIPNYGRVKVLFGLNGQEYKHEEAGIFCVDVKEVETRTQYRSLKIALQKRGYI